VAFGAWRGKIARLNIAPVRSVSGGRGASYNTPLPMAKKNVTPPKSFEDGLQELEQILADIESGALGLEDSLGKYERGTFLIEHCRGVLASASPQTVRSKGGRCLRR
jgi:exodeoxyribonuclease VII small subunit